VADGTIFERKGLQTAAIVTHTFRRAGDAMARVQGFTGYRYAAMEHPISSLDQGQIRQRAREVLPEVLAILGVEDRRPADADRGRTA
jgi:hypothetical protein